MKMQRAAAVVRGALKKAGENPKGRVSCRSNDYVSELSVDLRGIRGEALERVEAAINEMPPGDWTWNVSGAW